MLLFVFLFITICSKILRLNKLKKKDCMFLSFSKTIIKYILMGRMSRTREQDIHIEVVSVLQVSHRTHLSSRRFLQCTQYCHLSLARLVVAHSSSIGGMETLYQITSCTHRYPCYTRALQHLTKVCTISFNYELYSLYPNFEPLSTSCSRR